MEPVLLAEPQIEDHQVRLFADKQAGYFISSGSRDGPDVVLRKGVHHEVPHGVVVFDNKACRLAALGTNSLARCVKRLASVFAGPTRCTARRFATMVQDHLQFDHLLAALLMIAPNPRRSNSSGGSDPSTGSSVRFAIIHRRLRRSSSNRFTTTRWIR